MARSNLLKDVISNSISLETILLRLKVILIDLEDNSILEWIDGENKGLLPENDTKKLVRASFNNRIDINNCHIWIYFLVFFLG